MAGGKATILRQVFSKSLTDIVRREIGQQIDSVNKPNASARWPLRTQRAKRTRTMSCALADAGAKLGGEQIWTLTSSRSKRLPLVCTWRLTRSTIGSPTGA